MSLQQVLIDELKAADANLVGFAEMTDIPAEVRYNLPRAVSIAAAFDSSIIASVKDGPNDAYDAEASRMKELVESIGDKCIEILEKEGYQALHQGFFGTGFSRETISTPMPHKTAATLAGLGWIGKNCLLVTEDYGPAVALMTVHTDAPLQTGSPIDSSRCSDCKVCVDTCPVSAPSGENWKSCNERESFFDARTCMQKIAAGKEKAGYNFWLCGMCVAACPYTQNYINRSEVK